MKNTLLLALTFVTLSTAAAQPAGAPPEARQFDFWVGEWEIVHKATGQPAGKNRIELAHGGRVLIENYVSVGGFTGTSVNGYDAATGRWHQCWMDNSGLVLDIYGGMKDGNMVMTGETTQPNGTKQRERITWIPAADGTLRQIWDQSSDQGKTWRTVFDGLYRRLSAPSQK